MVDALQDSPRDQCLLVVGIYTGLRGGDLVHLRWSDVLTDHGTIKTKLLVQERKTGNARGIALNGDARVALTEWLRQCGEVDRDAFVFPSRKGGGALSTWALHNRINEWARLAGVVGHFGAHTLRRTYGYHQYQRTKDVAFLMRLFGHSHPSITLRYIGISTEEEDEANRALKIL